jgi:hypothetical protein
MLGCRLVDGAERMRCRLAAIAPGASAYECECGERFTDRAALSRHVFGPTLDELIAEVEAGWRSVARSWAQWQAQRERFELHRDEWVVA